MPAVRRSRSLPTQSRMDHAVADSRPTGLHANRRASSHARPVRSTTTARSRPSTSSQLSARAAAHHHFALGPDRPERSRKSHPSRRSRLNPLSTASDRVPVRHDRGARREVCKHLNKVLESTARGPQRPPDGNEALRSCQGQEDQRRRRERASRSSEGDRRRDPAHGKVSQKRSRSDAGVMRERLLSRQRLR